MVPNRGRRGDFNVIRGNQISGVIISPGADHNQIGGTSSFQRNIINNGPGVVIGGNSNTVQGNFIGTDITGTVAIPTEFGVGLQNSSSDNIIGGAEPGAGNLISGNRSSGISLNSYTSNTFIKGNYIGTDVTGTNPLPNGQIGRAGSGGIVIIGSFRNIVGGTESGGSNIIAFNHGPGIWVRHDFLARQNTISRNSIFQNDALSIDLDPSGMNDPEGVTPNDNVTDNDTGPNDLLNFPDIQIVNLVDNIAVVKGKACASCTVEVFLADLDASDHGEGKTFLGSSIANSNSGVFALVVSGLSQGDLLTATATDTEGNTSEFSSNYQVKN